jgi:anti-sigma B factor antagonist
MPQVNVTTNVRRVDATASVIDIQGEITAFAETALMDAYTHASTPTTRSIILNFNALDYMNSSGIGVLVTLLIRINRQKQHLLCYGLSDHYQKIFAITRLDDAIRNYATEEEALVAARAY